MSERAESDVISTVALRSFLCDDLSGVRRLDPPAFYVVVERALEDRVKVTATGGGYFGVRIITSADSILPSAIKVGLVINILTKPILCAIFKTRKNTIVSPAIEVNALVPRDLGCAS